jgi:hypothetical protein
MASDADPLVAMIALDSDRMPDLRAVFRSLGRVFPDLPPINSVQEKDGQILFPFGENLAAIALMPAPIPWPELEGPCETAWWWPEAAERLRGHTHHLIVALMGGAGDVRERHVRETCLVAALAKHTDAAGIYWGNGTLVHDAEAFQKQAEGLTAGNLVPHLWVDMRVEDNGDGTCCFFTTGMEAFSRREIEIERTPLDAESLLDLCYPVINYLLAADVKIRDGETVGRSAEERFKVTYGRSMFPTREKVMKLAVQ